jgi:hypothetical protein
VVYVDAFREGVASRGRPDEEQPLVTTESVNHKNEVLVPARSRHPKTSKNEKAWRQLS